MKIAQAGQITNPVLGPALQAKSGIAFFQGLVPALIGLMFVSAVLVFMYESIVGAINLINSGGDKASLETARSKLVHAIAGISILLSLFAIVKVIEFFFGINILEINLGPLKIT